MSDLIERQKVIDAFWYLDVEIAPSAIAAILEMLKSVPSTQPNLQPTCNELATVAKDTNVPCKDLISRQDALYALGAITMCNGSIPHDTAVMKIEQLPSAQPEPCEDAISRKAAIDAINSMFAVTPTQMDMKEDCLEIIENLPSAQPEPHWIPVSERLPEDDTLMLVNYVDHRPDAMDIWIGWHEMENVWYIDGEAHSEEFGNEVVAWMPLPETYRAERRTDEGD